MGFNERVAIVTGAASGIGREVATQLCEQGAKVVIADLNEDGAREVAASLTASGGTACAMAIDVSQPGHAQRVVADALHLYGHIDIWLYPDFPMNEFR